MRILTTAGGNLFAIAAANLGDATQWVRIAALNNLSDPMLQACSRSSCPMSIPTQEAALPLNELSTGYRLPRLVVLANGVPLAAPLSADVISNNHHAADRFHLTAALPSSTDAAFWATTSDIAIDVRVALTSNVATSLIEGDVDTVEIDATTGLLHLEGRDRTAALIEARTQETFANQTSSEIASLLAGRHGLTADVATTTTPVGRYWQLEHDHITLDQFSRATTEWDLLISLATHESFDVWVTGRTLHFRPGASAASSPSPAASLRPAATPSGPANVTALRLERALTLARDIEVTVKSWNSRQQTAFIQTARGGHGTGSGGQGELGGKPQRYVYVVPNLTPDAALKLAQSRLAELTRHERVVVAEMPGELTLTPRMAITVDGTASSFDQFYWIDEIERSLHWRHGFTQRVRARNISAAAAATSPAEPGG